MSIPPPERFIGGLLIKRWCRKHPPGETASLVRAQERELRSLIERAGVQATEPVQIKRLRGLEAVSTNYSLAMVAEHLASTNADMAIAIAALAGGRDPNLNVDIAKYKPSPEASADGALAALDQSLTEIESALADQPAIARATRKLAHPWFGPLSASTWACFPSFHQALHLRQAHLIVSGLG